MCRLSSLIASRTASAVIAVWFTVSLAYGQSSPHGPIKLPCINCHSTESWKELAKPLKFNHTATGFSLQGAHSNVQCIQCHTTKRFAGTSTDCFKCHTSDFAKALQPNHQLGKFSHDCLSCHTMTGWKPSIFQHSKTNFQLIGSHLSVDCASCHTNNQFAGKSRECFGCHQKDFVSTVVPNHKTGQFSHDCLSCHTMTGWKPSVFDHNKTNFTLTGAHASLGECSLCHTGGKFKGLPSDCFSCHQKNYAGTLQPNHVSAQLSHDCLTCHTNISWKPSTFDHNKTNFQLVGSHTTVECSSCHTNGKFAGLSHDCFTCHTQDFNNVKTVSHLKLAHDCLTCHTNNAWKPSTFVHNKTNFQLIGSHTTAECNSCHATTKFTGLPLDCYTCHLQDFNNVKSVNHSQLARECLTCHTTIVWKPSTFDHNKTKFQLTGGHITAECNSCHAATKFVGLPADCFTCHLQDFNNVKTVNHSQLSHECLTCHTTLAWKPSTFDHNKTQFQLTGAHASVECTSCHVNGKFTGLPTDCYSCHQQDYAATINPSHPAAQFSHDCLTCHSNMAWKPSTFNHSTTTFPLNGAHTSAACASCHINGVYKGLPTDCFSCHQNNFNSTVNPNHASAQFSHDCLTCHSTNAWKPSTFNHANTGFPLIGAHAAVVCGECHNNGQYKGTSTVCYDCHTSDFTGTTAPSHVVSQFSHDCLTCHSNLAWKPATFNHNTTAFQLVGAHVSRACVDCHKNGQYKGTTTDCYTCHLTDYNATTNPNHVSGQYTSMACITCHNTTAWKPWIFNHTPSFPISGSAKHKPGVWSACQDCHNSPGNFKSFACITCHEHSNKASVDNDHKGKTGYSYTSAACYQCHPQGRN